MGIRLKLNFGHRGALLKVWEQQLKYSRLFVPSKRAYPVGTVVTFNLATTGLPAPLEITGQVAQVREPQHCKPGQKPGFEVGFRFSQEQGKALVAYLKGDWVNARAVLPAGAGGGSRQSARSSGGPSAQAVVGGEAALSSAARVARKAREEAAAQAAQASGGRRSGGVPRSASSPRPQAAAPQAQAQEQAPVPEELAAMFGDLPDEAPLSSNKPVPEPELPSTSASGAGAASAAAAPSEPGRRSRRRRGERPRPPQVSAPAEEGGEEAGEAVSESGRRSGGGGAESLDEGEGRRSRSRRRSRRGGDEDEEGEGGGNRRRRRRRRRGDEPPPKRQGALVSVTRVRKTDRSDDERFPESGLEGEQLAQVLRQEVEKHLLMFDGQDHYQVLGIPRMASRKEIRKGYLRLMRRFHPDRYFKRLDADTMETLEEVYQIITEAHEVLIDDGSRADYDKELGA